MENIAIAKVAVDKTAFSFDKLYSYIIPEDFLKYNLVGSRVLVPFGFGSKTRMGVVLSISSEKPEGNMKSLSVVLDKAPLLNDEMVRLVFWMKERYYCTFFDAIKVIVPYGIQMNIKVIYKVNPYIEPSQIEKLKNGEKEVLSVILDNKSKIEKEKALEMFDGSKRKCFDNLIKKEILIEEEMTLRKINDASVKMVKVSDNPIDEKLSPKQKEAYELISSMEKVSVKEVCYSLGITVSVVNALVKKGICEYFEEETFRDPYIDRDYEDDQKEIILNDEQKKAYIELEKLYYEEKPNVSLLYGVTGSGKTSVFMKLIDKVYNENKGIIVMVPEIALTAQVVNIFKNRYKDDVAVFHSNLSMSERMDEWKRVKKGLAKIAVGTRSAVFAPFENLGLIVMDEEQEFSYKSERTPCFHARDIAKFRCNYNKVLLILSSATPSIESYYFSKVKKYHIHRLGKRYSGNELPNVDVVDMNEELQKGNDTPFSSEFVNKLKDTINLGKQAIILLNRRGYHTFASCKSCGEVVVCPSCSISMVYHSDNNRLMCHYCGYSMEMTNECPNCNENSLYFSGFGTQRIEEGLKSVLSGLRVLRMDADTTMTKFSHEKKLFSFANGEYDVMVGTQMVAKGLDFPNVTFVSILSADQALYSDDFRSYERAFSLFTQVIGRSGRDKDVGTALIQTYTPENNIIKLASKQDYDSFYDSEIILRRAMLYPPFVDIGVVGFIGESEKTTQNAANEFFSKLKKTVEINHENLPIFILAPSSANILKIKNKYR